MIVYLWSTDLDVVSERALIIIRFLANIAQRHGGVFVAQQLLDAGQRHGPEYVPK